MAGGSTKVIVISLFANLGIALSKLAAAIYTGSATLMAEAVHSFSDCGNQVLLLYGQRAAKRENYERYPLGRSVETFFWSFIVALLLFSMGGIFSIYEGVHKIQHPEEMKAPLVGIAVLVVAIGLEGFSFWACYKEVRAVNRFGSLWKWIRHTSAADLLVIFLEDFAALAGLTIALVILLAAWGLNMPVLDGVGSFLIGVLLIGTAVILAREVKPLLIGEAPAQDYEPAVKDLLRAIDPGMRLLRLIALHRGIDAVLLAYKVHPGEQSDTHQAIAHINRLEAAVKEKYPEVKWQFAELDVTD